VASKHWQQAGVPVESSVRHLCPPTLKPSFAPPCPWLRLAPCLFRPISHPLSLAHNHSTRPTHPTADFVDSGAMSPIVPMLWARQEAAREGAAEAVAALSSFHQDGKLAYLEGLVQALLRGPQAEVGGWVSGWLGAGGLGSSRSIASG